MPVGVGSIGYISDASENVSQVSTAGRLYLSDSYTRIKKHSPINVTAASGGTTFESVDVGLVYLRSESGNGIMWWGGTAEDSPYSGHGFPLWGGEVTPEIRVTNFNRVRVVASVSGQIIYPIGFLNGTDVELSNTTPTVTTPDITAPTVVSHVPVSGLSGVSRADNITATFSEAIASGSVISGVFRLSPAHNVTLYRDVTTATMIVMQPNVNLSGSTVYVAELISGGVSDLAGNKIATRVAWPFTTAAAPPPPDTTPPVVSGTSPTNGATSVDADTSVTVTFSETMLSGTIRTSGLFLSKTSGGNPNPTSYAVTLSAVDSKTATINPTSSLDEGTTYYINVKNTVQDLAGNAIAGAGDRGRNFNTVYNFSQVYSITGSTTADMYDGDDIRIGLELTDNTNTLSGSIPKRVVLRMRKVGSPTGIGSVVIRNSSDNVVFTFSQTINVASLSLSFTDVTVTDLTNTYTVQDGDRILFEWEGGSSSNKVELQKLSSDGFTGTRYTKYDGSYTNEGGQEIGWEVYA